MDRHGGVSKHRFGSRGRYDDISRLAGLRIDHRISEMPKSPIDRFGKDFIVADCPGHEQYTRNMATGASTADLAIVLVDARKGVLPQTRRHSWICALLGVKQYIAHARLQDFAHAADYGRNLLAVVLSSR